MSLDSLSTSTKQPGQDSHTATLESGLASPLEPFGKLPTGVAVDTVTVAIISSSSNCSSSTYIYPCNHEDIVI